MANNNKPFNIPIPLIIFAYFVNPVVGVILTILRVVASVGSAGSGGNAGPQDSAAAMRSRFEAERQAELNRQKNEAMREELNRQRQQQAQQRMSQTGTGSYSYSNPYYQAQTAKNGTRKAEPAQNKAAGEVRSDAYKGLLAGGIITAVIAGFYGADSRGNIRTLPRGGSDVTGAIVARAAKAAVYENWTDVSGMLSADPRIVDSPLPIKEISYKELRELSYMGASVMHEDAVFPVRSAGIPINIRNTNRPEDEGTWIVPHRSNVAESGSVVTGIAGMKGFSSISALRMRPSSLMRIFIISDRIYAVFLV